MLKRFYNQLSQNCHQTNNNQGNYMNLITFNEWCVKKGLLIEATPTEKMFTIEEKNGKTSTGWKPSRLKEFYFGEKGIEDWIDNCKQGDEFSDSYGGKIKCVFAPFSFSKSIDTPK